MQRVVECMQDRVKHGGLRAPAARSTRADRQTLLIGTLHGKGALRVLKFRETGAGEGIRTLDPNLGKVVLYP